MRHYIAYFFAFATPLVRLAHLCWTKSEEKGEGEGTTHWEHCNLSRSDSLESNRVQGRESSYLLARIHSGFFAIANRPSLKAKFESDWFVVRPFKLG